MKAITAVLLGAGSGTRFGDHKLLHPLPDGTPVGIATARRLVSILPDAVAVVRRGDDRLAEAYAALGLQVVENPAAAAGMGTSLATGIAAAPAAAGWLIALADMPWVEPATLRALAEALRQGASMVAPVYAGRRGNPVGFAARWGADLRALRGDHGGRKLLSTHVAELQLLPVDDPGVLRDVDHRTDLAHT